MTPVHPLAAKMAEPTQHAVPYRCPKCDGRGQLQYDPVLPFGNSSSSGPWKCPACTDGIIWAYPQIGLNAWLGEQWSVSGHHPIPAGDGQSVWPPKPVIAGSIPDKPALTDAEKAVQRAVKIMSER